MEIILLPVYPQAISYYLPLTVGLSAFQRMTFFPYSAVLGVARVQVLTGVYFYRIVMKLIKDQIYVGIIEKNLCAR